MPRRLLRRSVLWLAIPLVLAPSAANAATITVTTTGDTIANDGQCSLREAITASNTGTAANGCPAGGSSNTIALPAGTIKLTKTGVSENNNVTGDLDVKKNTVDLVGQGDGKTTIDGNKTDRVLDISTAANVTVEKLTIANGKLPTEPKPPLVDNSDKVGFGANGAGGTRGQEGGAIVSKGTLTVTLATLKGNAAGGGQTGGDGKAGPGLVRTNGVEGHTGGEGGGVDGAPGGNGGAIASHGSLTLDRVTLTGNNAGAGGNGGAGTGGRGGENDTLAGGVGGPGGKGSGGWGGDGGSGGGVFSDGALDVKRSTFTGNKAGDGGSGGLGTGGPGDDQDGPSELSAGDGGDGAGGKGAVGGAGGGIAAAKGAIADTTFTQNTTGRGGQGNNGIAGNGGNGTSGGGGGLPGNSSGGNAGNGGAGGGIFASGPIALGNVLANGNKTGIGGTGATGQVGRGGTNGFGDFSAKSTGGNGGKGGSGGGFGSAGAATRQIFDSTFDANGTGYGGPGGGAGAAFTSTPGVRGAAGDGGGLDQAAGTTTYMRLTISGNTLGDATGAGGALNYGTGLSVTGTVFANNAAPRCSGPGFTDGPGLIDFPADPGCPGANVDPGLLPLADNGGLTFTRALPAGSPARDTFACKGTDQREVPRPSGAACDSGAYEAAAPAPASVDAFAASTSATLAATVNPNARASTYKFEYGTSALYGNATPAGSLPAGTEAQTVTAEVTGLAPGTTYHYRVSTTNADGTSASPDQTFTTPALGSDKTAPVVSKLKVRPPTFAVAKGSTAKSAGKTKAKPAPKGTTISFTLSEPATVKLAFSLRATGKKSKSKKTGKTVCVTTRRLPSRKSDRCTLYLSAGSLSRKVLRPGAFTVAFSGRVGREALERGTYRLSITAKDAAGNTSKASTASFTVVAASKKK